MNDCLFCRISDGSAPARVVLEDDELIAFHDTRPQAPVHVLVIPRRHLASVAAANAADEALLGRLLHACAEVARKTGVDGDGFRVVTNSGRLAGQSVDHLHLHVLGGRPLGWPPG